jgi:hypothetical protein
MDVQGCICLMFPVRRWEVVWVSRNEVAVVFGESLGECAVWGNAKKGVCVVVVVLVDLAFFVGGVTLDAEFLYRQYLFVF